MCEVSYESEGKYELSATDESEAEPGGAAHGFRIVEIPVWMSIETKQCCLTRQDVLPINAGILQVGWKFFHKEVAEEPSYNRGG